MMGVDYELFWRLNPKSLSPFIKAFYLKRKYDDAMAWNTGAYIRMAIASSLSKDAKYPNKPMLAEIDFENIKQESQDEKIKRRFMERMEILNMRFKKEESDGK